MKTPLFVFQRIDDYTIIPAMGRKAKPRHFRVFFAFKDGNFQLWKN